MCLSYFKGGRLQLIGELLCGGVLILTVVKLPLVAPFVLAVVGLMEAATGAGHTSRLCTTTQTRLLKPNAKPQWV